MSPVPRRIRLILAYDGTDFAGWQFQPRQRTVQGVLLDALHRLQGGGRISLRGAGRTDAGVHAEMQVADCLLRCRLDDAGVLHALSRLLPEDVRPRKVQTVPEEFHSQYDARAKTYRYALDHSPYADPFVARYTAHFGGALDMKAMASALEHLPGKRDWSGFASVAALPGNHWRNMTEAVMIRESNNRTIFRFTADGFLNHMVRNIVGALLEIGKGRFEIGRISEILHTGDRYLAGKIAPARGLTLETVYYDSTEV